MTALDCEQLYEIAPDLALGLLAGTERGAAVNHLATCTRCRRHVEALVQVTDDLQLLAPSIEPEIGFESRVMARLATAGAFGAPALRTEIATASGAGQPEARVGPTTSSAPPPPRAASHPQRAVSDSGTSGDGNGTRGRVRGTRRPWSKPAVGVAAALIVVAGVAGLATGLTRGRQAGRDLQQLTQSANQLAARTVVVRADSGRSTCQLVAFPGQGTQPARLVIHLDEVGDPQTAYQVLAEPTDGGPAVPIGQIAMVGGHGTVTAAIPVGTGPVDAVRIMEGPDTVRYRATFQSV